MKPGFISTLPDFVYIRTNLIYAAVQPGYKIVYTYIEHRPDGPPAILSFIIEKKNMMGGFSILFLSNSIKFQNLSLPPYAI